MHNLSHIKNSKSILGEGPFYKEDENSLYWTDIKDFRIYKYDLNNKKVEHFQFSKAIGSFVFTSDNKILATTNEGYEFLDLKSKEITSLLDPEKDLPNNRFNDGKCDANGRYFAGTMDNNEESITGSLYCLSQNSIEKKEKDLFISNGLGWNNDSSKFYLTDSPKRLIYVYDYDLKTSKISSKQIFAKISKEDGYPDGLCLDEEDHIWSAHWAGSKITRYKPDGNIDRIINLPVPNVTSCCFGGEDFKTLFITSAQKGLSEEELKQAPLSGSTFVLETNIKGQKPNFYKN
jgi:sugar lactone lactonase YvrE